MRRHALDAWMPPSAIASGGTARKIGSTRYLFIRSSSAGGALQPSTSESDPQAAVSETAAISNRVAAMLRRTTDMGDSSGDSGSQDQGVPRLPPDRRDIPPHR